MYGKIFHKDFNLSFGYLRSVTCEICDLLNVDIRACTDENERVEKQIELSTHQEIASQGYQLPHSDAEIFDLMQNLPVPTLSHGSMFYSRKLWVYSATSGDVSSLYLRSCQVKYFSVIKGFCVIAAIGTKREREWDVSDVEEGKGVSVHGIPVYVSPVKESSRTQGMRYFEARQSDGKKCARVVSLDPSHRDAMKKVEESKKVVLLSNPTAKKSSLSRDTEVHMDKCSKVLESLRKTSLGDVVPFAKAAKIADIVKSTASQNLDVTCKGGGNWRS